MNGGVAILSRLAERRVDYTFSHPRVKGHNHQLLRYGSSRVVRLGRYELRGQCYLDFLKNVLL